MWGDDEVEGGMGGVREGWKLCKQGKTTAKTVDFQK